MADAQPSTSRGTDLLSLSFGPNNDFHFSMGWPVWLFLLAASALWVWWRLKSRGSLLRKSYEIDSTELGIGSSKIVLKPNMGDRAVAYKIWVELSTRKIGLPIDFDHDVIAEVYDSWYSFFAITRELIKDVPVSRVRNETTKKIINLSIDVLNQGLRPHLTQWQARFRHWYELQLSKDPDGDVHPQDIQKRFPAHDELVKSMREVNARLIRYRERMDELVHL